MVHPRRTAARAVPALGLALAACVPALTACTINFTPGDAKPAVYTPYPKAGASAATPSEGQGMRGGPGTPQ